MRKFYTFLLIVLSTSCISQETLKKSTIHIVRPSSFTYFRGKSTIHISDTIYYVHEKVYFQVNVEAASNQAIKIGLNNNYKKDITVVPADNVYILISRFGMYPFFRKMELYELTEASYNRIIDSNKVRKGKRKYDFFQMDPRFVRIIKK